ncbi:cyclin-dependent kinase-like 2 [Erethizon dorsatum]
MAIPPLAHTPSAAASGGNPGAQSYRVDEKTKKYCIPFVKPNKHSPSGIYNMNVPTSVSSEKNLLQASEKQREYSRTEVCLPELSHSHLPELRALEGMARNSRLIKKENKILSESRIPSLAAVDLHSSSVALHQVVLTVRVRDVSSSFYTSWFSSGELPISGEHQSSSLSWTSSPGFR